jgi:phosphoglycerol transferase MdoB-like AlkP superfamily enzyme
VKFLKRGWPLEVAFAFVLMICFWLPRFDLIHKVSLNASIFTPFTIFNLLLFDLVVIGYFLLPWLVFSIAWPSKRTQPKFFRTIFFVYLAFSVFLAVLCCVSEFFFIDEFSSRYNFIAVDYLVYTSEVLKNIWESYSIVPIMALLIVLSLTSTWLLSRNPRRFTKKQKGILLAVFVILFFVVREERQLDALNESQREFSKNSFHALFTAFRNNEIDFDKFYITLPKDEAFATTRRDLLKDYTADALPKENQEDLSLIANIQRGEAPKDWNVIFVLMESMSAKYLASYGGEGITPNLDRLRNTGLAFDNFYSTGTRTVRGLEAVLLSLPPTPGQSILRRPKSDDLFTLGSVFRGKSYTTDFIYGGHAFFDNMREFFESNHFGVLDQGDIPSELVHFSNAWGICDQDVFDFAVTRANDDYKAGKKFFQLILTTSNHRPYTFPPDKIDRPSGSGREAAIKYSDYAIGEFLKSAEKQPWFDKTLFIFVADHDAAVAGGTKILPSDYHIPFILYGPKLLKTERIDKLGSQIDVAPTILGLLDFSYQTRFFGHDLRKAVTERAFLGTYQKLAYMEKDRMIVLAPPKKWEEFKLGTGNPELLRSGASLDASNEMLKSAISYYQTASDEFRTRAIGLEKKYPTNVNLRNH